MGRRDWRGAETIGVLARISSRPAEPRESRAKGYSRGSNGCLLLADSLFCCVRDSFFMVRGFFWESILRACPFRKGVAGEENFDTRAGCLLSVLCERRGCRARMDLLNAPVEMPGIRPNVILGQARISWFG